MNCNLKCYDFLVVKVASLHLPIAKSCMPDVDKHCKVIVNTVSLVIRKHIARKGSGCKSDDCDVLNSRIVIFKLRLWKAANSIYNDELIFDFFLLFLIFVCSIYMFCGRSVVGASRATQIHIRFF